LIDPEEPRRDALLAVGGTLVLLAALFQLADGIQVVALSLLRGVQDTQVPMVIAAFSYWVVGIPAGYVLAFVVGWAQVGLWLGLTSGLATAAVLLMWRFWRRAVRIGGPAHV
jgi:MATE family multidrug resistance protein